MESFLEVNSLWCISTISSLALSNMLLGWTYCGIRSPSQGYSFFVRAFGRKALTVLATAEWSLRRRLAGREPPVLAVFFALIFGRLPLLRLLIFLTIPLRRLLDTGHLNSASLNTLLLHLRRNAYYDLTQDRHTLKNNDFPHNSSKFGPTTE